MEQVRRKTQRTQYERAGKTPTHPQMRGTSLRNKAFLPIIATKKDAPIGASFRISSLNFTALLTFIRILLFLFFQFLLSLFACIEFLDFRYKESMTDCGSSISYRLCRASWLVWYVSPLIFNFQDAKFLSMVSSGSIYR